MEKICLARRISERNKSLEPKDASSSDDNRISERSILIKPSELAHSLVQALIANNDEHAASAPGSRKFELEVQYDPASRFYITVNLEPLRNGPSKEWLTAEETAQRLRLSKATVYRELLAGNLVGMKVGRQWRIPASKLDGGK